MATTQLEIVASTSLADYLAHVLSCQSRVCFLQRDEEDIFNLFQSPGLRQLFADQPERFAHMCQDEHQAEFGHLAQTCQGAYPLQEEAHELAAQPSLALCSSDKFGDHGFGLLCSALELHIWRQVWIFELEVVGEHAEDMRRVFGPA